MMGKWQAIETVPKDGTIVDLKLPKGGIIHGEWWVDDLAAPRGGYFVCQIVGAFGFTHWRLAKGVIQ